MKTQEDKKAILTKSRVLQNSNDFSETKLAQDLTPTQQKERRSLVEELNRRKEDGEEDLVLRGNKIVMKPQKNNEPLQQQDNEEPVQLPEGGATGQDTDAQEPGAQSEDFHQTF